MFRFVSVYFGALLEPFLAGGGKALETKSPWEKDLIVKNEVGSRRKITFYEKAITTIDSFHYKTILYFVSFVARAVEKQLVYIFKKKEKISKVFFYFVFVHNRVHFALMSIFLSGGVFLNTRTLLHMKLYPETWILVFDKLLALVCFFFYWIDICEMFSISIKYIVQPQKHDEETEAKMEDRKKEIKEKLLPFSFSFSATKKSVVNNSIAPLRDNLDNDP